MSQSKETLYSIPARFRKMENMHIVFWLMKDISWCMIWKELGHCHDRPHSYRLPS